MGNHNIKLLVYDFDGVMTDNKVYVDQKGNEMVQVNRADGLGVSEIKKLGIEQIIISTEKNTVVTFRAAKLGIPCLQGVDNKKAALMDYCKKNDIDIQKAAYVGNDINDKDAMEIVGFTYSPADAHESIKAISDQVLRTKGGHGVIRELLDFIIEKKGV
ncbi:MAG: HAD hydrolase family protein [Candidatus Marinimicrobia bacterium]|nr:HAD hydrolase family protein [Candidatus Neomarinimicrobiota bacterium]